jgi:hypothetical protein
MSKGGRFIALAASAILLFVVSLGSLGALAEEPGRPKTTGYPAVEDVPPRPEKPAMTADEQVKLKKELSATRDHHQAPKRKSGAGAGQPVKPWLHARGSGPALVPLAYRPALGAAMMASSVRMTVISARINVSSSAITSAAADPRNFSWNASRCFFLWSIVTLASWIG